MNASIRALQLEIELISDFAQGLAIMELKTALAVLCQQFEFCLSKDSTDLCMMREKMALTLQAAHGVRLRFVPRGTAQYL